MTTPPAPYVLPRSFLYVPGVNRELFAKAAGGRADALVLDLEDAVPVPLKDEARDHVRWWVGEGAPAAGGAAETWVRVNGDSADSIHADLDAAVQPTLSGIFLAKCSPESLAEAAGVLDRLERSRGLRGGAVCVVGLVETATALLDLGTIVRASRLTTLGIGEVDLLADLRMARTPRSAAALDALRAQVVAHCAAAGRQAPVAPTSTAYRDLEAFAESSRHLHDLGFRSRTAIHPAQVDVVNEVFSPTEEAVAAARDVVARFEAAAGGVTTDAEGRLIDAAVVRGARETLARAAR